MNCSTENSVDRESAETCKRVLLDLMSCNLAEVETVRFSQAFVNLCHTTLSYIPEHRNLYASRENTAYDKIIIYIVVNFNQAHADPLLHYIASCGTVENM
jgi:hypothetical protein